MELNFLDQKDTYHSDDNIDDRNQNSEHLGEEITATFISHERSANAEGAGLGEL